MVTLIQPTARCRESGMVVEVERDENHILVHPDTQASLSVSWIIQRNGDQFIVSSRAWTAQRRSKYSWLDANIGPERRFVR